MGTLLLLRHLSRTFTSTPLAASLSPTARMHVTMKAMYGLMSTDAWRIVSRWRAACAWTLDFRSLPHQRASVAHQQMRLRAKRSLKHRMYPKKSHQRQSPNPNLNLKVGAG